MIVGTFQLTSPTSVDDPTSVTNLVLMLRRDDGVVVYLNGTGIFTNNLPAGPIGYQTYATNIVGNADESTFYSQNVNAALLVSGINVLAAEIHQVNTNSSDIIFDLELTGFMEDEIRKLFEDDEPEESGIEAAVLALKAVAPPLVVTSAVPPAVPVTLVTVTGLAAPAPRVSVSS